MTPDALAAAAVDDLHSAISTGIYGDDRMTRQARGAAIDALAELVRRVEAMRLELEEQRLVLAAEQGKPEGAPSPGWEWNSRYRSWRKGHLGRTLLVNEDVDCVRWFCSNAGVVTAQGKALNLRGGMIDADAARAKQK